MRLNYLKNPSLKTMTFKAEKLDELTAFYYNACINDEMSSSPTFKLVHANGNVNIKKCYVFGERLFLFGVDNVLYEYKDGVIDSLTGKLPSEPLFCEVLHGGYPNIFVLCQNYAFIIGRMIINSCDIPYCDAMASFNGRIFVGAKDKLYYTKEFNLSKNMFDYSLGGQISFGLEDGDIISLNAVSNYLLVVCERAIYKLILNSDLGFGLEKFNVPKLNVYKNSVKDLGDEILFISDGTVYSYKNGSVDKINSKLYGLNVNILGDAKTMGRVYYFPITRKSTGKNYVFFIDRSNNREGIISAPNLTDGDGGYLGNNFNLYLLSHDGDVLFDNVYWESKNLTLESACKKSVIGINVYVTENATMKVFGDFGEKRFYLKKGANVKKMNLFSDNIKIQVISSSNTFALKDLQIKYRKIGD